MTSDHPDSAAAEPVLLTEAATLARIFPRLPEADATLLGPGDDCAVLAAPDGRYVVTTDMMVHGPDFRLAWSTPFDLGWKAVASNLADVAAMGAAPTALLVAIAAPPNTPATFFDEFADGLREGCAAMAPGCGVVGGDLSTSATLTLAVTAFGDLQGRAPVLRSGARPGDVVAVAGILGQAGAGLKLLFAEGVDEQGHPDAERGRAVRDRHPHAVQAQLAPTAPIALGIVAAVGGATAMLDVSDGLALDAQRLAQASGVHIDLFTQALGDDPHLALTGGEDHALLATFGSDAVLPDGFRKIGVVIAVSERESEHPGVTVDGEVIAVGGWDPYQGWDGVVG